MSEEERPNFENIYMGLALSLARRSTCSRLQVGTVITSDDYRHVFAVGYNGGAAGQQNACESLEPGLCMHIHSEANAIINCVAPRREKKRVFVSHLPCKMCTKMLVNLGGVERVFYFYDYRKKDGRDVLLAADILVYQFAFEGVSFPALQPNPIEGEP